jgi:hypothetical protein
LRVSRVIGSPKVAASLFTERVTWPHPRRVIG